MGKIQYALRGHNLIADGVRFIFAGGINTLLTLGVYQLALFFMPHFLAYSISWLIGVMFLIVVYPSKVFPGSDSSLKRSIAAVLVYIVVFGISLWCLGFVISLGIHERLAIFIVLVLSTTLNFTLMRLVFRK